MRIPEILADQIDAVVAVASFLGALACAYLAKVTSKEHDPLVWLQQTSLVILATALFANGIYVFPEGALINGHRPTGVIAESAMAFNMIVMAARSYIRFFSKNGTRNGAPSSRQTSSG